MESKEDCCGDSDNEVFFDSRSISANSASTPISDTRTIKKKRKRSPPPKSTCRLRSRMSGTENECDGSGMGEEEEDSAKSLQNFMQQMTTQMAQMNANIEGMQDGMRTTVAEAIAPLQTRIDANTKRMDKIENRQRSDLAAVQIQIEKIMKNQEKAGTNSRSSGTTYANAASLPKSSAASAATGFTNYAKSDSNSWYWDARKKLRFFPIKGENEEQLLQSLDHFVLNKLKIPAHLLNKKDVQFIRRVRSTKNS